jgi:hypothetical protein
MSVLVHGGNKRCHDSCRPASENNSMYKYMQFSLSIPITIGLADVRRLPPESGFRGPCRVRVIIFVVQREELAPRSISRQYNEIQLK